MGKALSHREGHGEMGLDQLHELVGVVGTIFNFPMRKAQRVQDALRERLDNFNSFVVCPDVL